MLRVILAAVALAVAMPLTASANPAQGSTTSATLVADSHDHGAQQEHGGMSQGAMSGDAMGASYEFGNMKVDSPWSRATTGRAGGVFMMIHNRGRQGDRLIGAETDVAARVELHTTIMEDGVMRMRQVEDGIEVPADGMAELKPGGFHVMLMGLKRPLEEGSSFPVTLVFEKAGEVAVDVQVRAAGAMDAGMQHDH